MAKQTKDTISIGFEDKQYFCKLVSNDDVLNNDCNLSVSAYVEQEDTREKIDIEKVNEELKTIVENVNRHRTEVDQIIAEL